MPWPAQVRFSPAGRGLSRHASMHRSPSTNIFINARHQLAGIINYIPPNGSFYSSAAARTGEMSRKSMPIILAQTSTRMLGAPAGHFNSLTGLKRRADGGYLAWAADVGPECHDRRPCTADSRGEIAQAMFASRSKAGLKIRRCMRRLTDYGIAPRSP